MKSSSILEYGFNFVKIFVSKVNVRKAAELFTPWCQSKLSAKILLQMSFGLVWARIVKKSHDAFPFKLFCCLLLLFEQKTFYNIKWKKLLDQIFHLSKDRKILKYTKKWTVFMADFAILKWQCHEQAKIYLRICCFR